MAGDIVNGLGAKSCAKAAVISRWEKKKNTMPAGKALSQSAQQRVWILCCGPDLVNQARNCSDRSENCGRKPAWTVRWEKLA
ncbi:hypothetical protein [Vandammella animalimorsus]|uniref:hypothetical protein n=1 Tax=Vandammella animalimorsus TaxID=2029117 RepID=UPI001EEF4867|nr:hypothetical protein [Vandammella animalimorsus]